MRAELMLERVRELSFVSQEAIASVPYFCYPVQLNSPVDPQTLPTALGRLASQLKWQHKTAILSDISQVAILSPHPLESDTSQYTLLREEKIDLAQPKFEYFLFQVCNYSFFKAFETFVENPPNIDYYRKRIYSAEKPQNVSVLESSSLIEGKRYLTFDFIKDVSGHLVLVLDFASEYYSRATLDELGLEGIEPGQKLVQKYDKKSCEFVGVSELTINTPLVELGNYSLIQYHLAKQTISDGDLKSLNPSTPCVRVRYRGSQGKRDFEALHIPQLLQKLFDRSDVAPDLFHDQLWPISQKVEKAIATIQFLNKQNRFKLYQQPIKFCESLRQPQTIRYFLQGQTAKNLYFGVNKNSQKSSLVPYPNAALRNYQLLQKPDEIKASILFPNSWENKAKQYTDSLTEELHQFGIQLKRVAYSYNPKNPIEIRQICQELKAACNFVIGYVPKPGEEGFTYEVNPYKLIKSELVKRQIPSQMITQSTLFKGWNKFVGWNIILGINAKLGYLSWKLNEMPGTAQAFIGLDIGRNHNLAVAASAFVLDTYGQLIGWSNTKFQPHQETFDTQALRNLFFDLFSLYQQEFGHPLQHVVIHRDGKLQDTEYQLLAELKTELASAGLEKMDIVEIIKSGTCRAVQVNSTPQNINYSNPEKGYAWEHCRHEAIILTTGQREAKISQNSSPRPLRIRHRLGETDLLTLAEQVFWLSEMQVGSTQTIRLPITTYYSDRAADFALAGIIPVGIQRDKQLWFL